MNNMVISTRIRLARNLKGFSFPHKLNHKDAEEITSRVQNALAPIIKDFTLVKMSDVDNVTKQMLAENGTISPDAANNRLCRVFIKKDGGAEITVNEEDHVRIQTLRRDDNIDAAFELVNRLDDLLDESLSFAFSDKYGYLTACLTNTGTGMRASYMLHLPMLEKTKQIKALEGEIGRFGMVIRGSHGEGSEAVGSLYQLSNQVTLGKSEREIINDLNNIMKQITAKEAALREKVKGDAAFEDVIFRSLGILKYCKTISAKEAMEHLSNVKMGIESGIIKDKEDNIYNIMTDIQPSVIKKKEGQALSNAEICKKRAEYLNKTL
ncbi:MAG: ATP--guanido phosphotransferase [Clostridiales bacterium]|nr:ATP--guanido phosphotransferase [Clostridiales bacterium]